MADDGSVRAFCLAFGLDHQSFKDNILVKYLQDMRWRLAGSRTPQKDCYVAIDIVLMGMLGFTRPAQLMGGVAVSADGVNVILVSTMPSFRGALSTFSATYSYMPPDVERSVIERVVLSPHMPDLCRVSGTALVRCGFFLTTCYNTTSGKDRNILRLMSTVLDYDVTRVAGPKIKSYWLSRRPIIQMFQESHPGRCEALAEYLKVSSDPRVLRVETHSSYPPTLSLLIDSEKPLSQREIMGHAMSHERCDGFTLCPLEDPATQRDFNPWAYPDSSSSNRFMSGENLRFLYSMGFNDHRKINLLLWLVYVSNVVETSDVECLILLNKTQVDDLLELLMRDGYILSAGTLSLDAPPNSYLTVDRVDAAHAFGSKRTETGQMIANPLTYAPAHNACFLLTMESLNLYLAAAILGHEDCRLTNEELDCWDDIEILVRHPVTPPDRHMSFREVMKIMLSSTSDNTLMDRLSTLKTAVAVHRMSKINESSPDSASSVSCRVCLGHTSSTTKDHTPLSLPCGHVFGRQCLTMLQRTQRANDDNDEARHYTCPTCRSQYKISDLRPLFF